MRSEGNVPSKETRAAAAGAGRVPRASSLIDPGALMRIKNLELRAKVVVDGFLSGLHKSPVHGLSVEFTEYRQYSPGDDLRYLVCRLLLEKKKKNPDYTLDDISDSLCGSTTMR